MRNDDSASELVYVDEEGSMFDEKPVNAENVYVRPSMWVSLKETVPAAVALTAEAKKGDACSFGAFKYKVLEYDSIEWLVLDVEDGKTLLLAKDSIMIKPYDERTDDETMAEKPASWEESGLRAWLNGEFLAGFSDSDKAKIQGEVFILSKEEAEKYLPDNASRVAKAPDKIMLEEFDEVSLSDKGWWLRDITGKKQKSAMAVEDNGAIESSYGVESNGIGARPAMWVNLN